jgi:hypothetical protein
MNRINTNKKIAMKRHLLKSHITITDYAKLKQVYPVSVYDAIRAGKIEPDVIVQSKVKMIDLKKYGSFEFQNHNPDKNTLNLWFERKGRSKANRNKMTNNNE